MDLKRILEGKNLSDMKRKLLKVTLVFFLFMIAFTIISRTAFSVTAVQVQTVVPNQDEILHDFHASGELMGKQELAVSTVEGILVKTVSVSEGESVIRGRTLYQLDAEGLQEAIDSCRQELALPENHDDNRVQETEEEGAFSTKEQKEKELRELLTLQLNGGRVCAKGAGMITEINIKAGDKTTGGGDILYADASQGLQLVVQITEEERESLNKSGTVTVTGENGKSVSNLKVNSISADKESPELYNVKVNIRSKKLKIGSMAEMEVEHTEGPFETCIPREALHLNDRGTYYVYAVKKTETVLGEQLEAQQINVELLDKNDTTAAVEGITREQEIITEAAKDIEDKSRVRRQDL